MTLAIFITNIALAASALPHSPTGRAEVFAKCSGDLGALATFRRNHTGGDHETPLALQKTFDVLLDAILPDALEYGLPENQAAHWRFHAWVTHSNLLNDVEYSIDTRRKTRAKSASEARVIACTELLLTGN
ncbi:MAG: hypothetical protein ABJ327_23095 [Litoreibacter sp.]